jgi:hypothetical protein
VVFTARLAAGLLVVAGRRAFLRAATGLLTFFFAATSLGFLVVG